MSDFIDELRELTSSGRERIAEAELRAREEAKQKEAREQAWFRAKADPIIAQIKDRCRKEAFDGRDHVVVMNLNYKDFNGTSNRKLVGAAALVWDYCVKEDLNPTLEEWSIVVHW